MKLDLRKNPWLTAAPLIAVFDAIEAAGGEIRVNGGAVRNALMGLKVEEVDLSTTLEPDQTTKALETAGLKAVPTGLDHGTITAVSSKTGYEITSLREDIETDGRHAVVRFGTDWEEDAKRRDLTINALYCNRDGEIFDPIGGMEDVENRVIRFIGDPVDRITEDHLRILRFFRFFAWYGSGRPDGEGLKACTRLREGLNKISAERIWMELRKLLSAPDPSRALLWMRTTGVLSLVVPESEKWGIDLVPHLVAAERKWRWRGEGLLRLAAMIRPDEANVTTLARRLKLSKAEQDRLTGWAMSELPGADSDNDALARRLYLGNPTGLTDRMKLETARLVMNGEDKAAGTVAQKVRFAMKWKRPLFPLKGQDLIDHGMTAGPEVGKRLKALEQQWVASDFTLTRKQLLESV